MPVPSLGVRFALLTPLVVAVIVGSAFVGPTALDWNSITHFDGDHINVFWQLRVPRSLLAAAAGAALAIGGVILQALFRNPLAEPYTLGIASGASLAAALGLLLSGVAGFAWLSTVPLAVLAFAGAALAMLAVVLVSRMRRGGDMARVLLAGVCVAYICSAGILLVTFLADRNVTNEIVKWMMGSLVTVRAWEPLQVTVILVPVLAFALRMHRALDLLSFGPELAAARGVAVRFTVWSSFALVGLLTAVVVAHCGPIGFIGLMVPHMGRALFGARTWPLLCGSTLIGAGFLTACDALARGISVLELPVGVVTNILGAGFFLYLLATREILPAGGR